MLLLNERQYTDVTIRITFADSESVPSRLRFEHAPKPTSAFTSLGQVPLHSKSMKQLKHVFRLGPDTVVHRCLRISCAGHIAKAPQHHSGVHAVSLLLVTGKSTNAVPDNDAGTGDSEATSAMSAEGPAAAVVPYGEVEVHVSVNASTGHTPVGSTNRKESNMMGVNNAVQKKKAPPPPPPPPGAGGVVRRGAAAPPPPPPLPSDSTTRTTHKTTVKPALDVPEPSRPTLRLFWDKIAPRASTIKGTVWGEMPAGQASMDFAQLEEEFAAKQPAVLLKVLQNINFFRNDITFSLLLR